MAQRAMASRNGPPPKQTSVSTPNQTLYCTNLPDKLRKPDLRLSLYTLFSTYGPVLDVVAMSTDKMRGQAFIVYRDVQTSTQAMRALDGFDFFGKKMKIAYAKGKSDTIAKLDGTYRMPTAAGVVTTELQQSIFNAPPSSVPIETAPPGLPKPPPPLSAANGVKEAEAAAQSAQGVKRSRDEESDDEEEEEEEDAPMEEDDSDAPMEGSSDEED